jgi:hypothetical protein
MSQEQANVEQTQQMPARFLHPEGKFLRLEKGPDQEPAEGENQGKKKTAGIPGIEGDGQEQSHDQAPSFFPGAHRRRGESIELPQAEGNHQENKEKK